MPIISAIINTRNEEKNIRACLETVKWCDEIIVVDMESEDKTVEIAREYTEKIYDFNKLGYVEPARKFAVSKACGDWILLLDADERVTIKLAIKLREISKSDSNADVYRLQRRNYILGKWMQYTGWHPDYQIRFFKNGALEFRNEIHSSPMFKGKDHNLPVTDGEYLVHFNYFDSTQFIEKLNIYTSVEAVQMAENNKNFKVRYLITKPFKVFIDRFIVHKGYKDGIIGFFLSVYMSFYRFLTWVKYWEIVVKLDAKANYHMIDEQIIEEHKSSGL